ncbi:MAG: hypothetical protein AAF806_13675 [Bacteroidota bacterium]
MKKLINNPSSSSQANTGEPLALPFPEKVEKLHDLFVSRTMSAVFESFDLDLLALSQQQGDLLDQVHKYLLNGRPKNLRENLVILSPDWEDLWITLKGNRSLMIEHQLKNLTELDACLSAINTRILRNLRKKHGCDDRNFKRS